MGIWDTRQVLRFVYQLAGGLIPSGGAKHGEMAERSKAPSC